MLRSISCLLVLMLTACGQSGALYLPDQEPKSQAPRSLSIPSTKPADEESDKLKKAVPAPMP